MGHPVFTSATNVGVTTAVLIKHVLCLGPLVFSPNCGEYGKVEVSERGSFMLWKW